jgi:hypothetical protein
MKKQIVFTSLLYFILLSTSMLSAQNEGVGFVWARGNEDELLSRPYIQFGQAEFVWKDIEPNEGDYRWEEMDAVLKKYHDLGKRVPVQINTPVPEWVFKYVACMGTSRRGNAPQYWDPRYLNILEKMISKYAEHLGTSPYKDAVLSVRGQYNAINTEIFSLKAKFINGTATSDRTKWTFPADGHKYEPNLTPRLEGELIQKINEMYMKYFYSYGIPVTLRLPSQKELDQRGFEGEKIFDLWCKNPLSRLLTTHYSISLIGSEEMKTFKRRCRELGTKAFMEQVGSITTEGKSVMSTSDLMKMRQITLRKKGKSTFVNISKEQSTYWSMLMLLDCGASYISLYGKDLKWVDSCPEIVSVFNLINRYAGFQATPEKSPGAWRVFGEFFPKISTQPSENNWGWYLSEESLTNTQAVNFSKDSVDVLGVYARKFTGAVKFSLQPKFVASLSGTTKISVVYLPAVGESVDIPGATVIGSKKYFGKWIVKSFSIPAETIGKGFMLMPKGQPIIHLLEVNRNSK